MVIVSDSHLNGLVARRQRCDNRRYSRLDDTEEAIGGFEAISLRRGFRACVVTVTVSREPETSVAGDGITGMATNDLRKIGQATNRGAITMLTADRIRGA